MSVEETKEKSMLLKDTFSPRDQTQANYSGSGQ